MKYTAVTRATIGLFLIACMSLTMAGTRDSLTHMKSNLSFRGAGGFTDRFGAFDMSPIADLAKTDPRFAGITFPALKADFQPIIMSGGLIYAGIENGLRIGFAGYNGWNRFMSDRQDNGEQTELNFEIETGGLFLEKAFIREKWNLYAGTIIGGGHITIETSTGHAGSSSIFTSAHNFKKDGEASARLLSFELHGGATYSVIHWLHIGADISATQYYSYREFSTTGNLYGIMPSFGLRFVFGNLG